MKFVIGPSARLARFWDTTKQEELKPKWYICRELIMEKMAISPIQSLNRSRVPMRLQMLRANF